MTIDFKGKTAVVIGGTSGIGKSTAELFWKYGCRVAVCGNNPAKVEKLSAQWQHEPNFWVQQTDATSPQALDHFGQQVLERFGRVDIWVNNVGWNRFLELESTTENDFQRVVDLNLKSVFFGCQTAARLMRMTSAEKKAPGGVILNTSSFAASIASAGAALYGAVKAAVEILTASLAGELAADGIRVAGIAPGMIETDMTRENILQNRETLLSQIALGQFGQPEDIAQAYAFLASDAARYITGVTLPVNGGKLCIQNPAWSWNQKMLELQTGR